MSGQPVKSPHAEKSRTAERPVCGQPSGQCHRLRRDAHPSLSEDGSSCLQGIRDVFACADVNVGASGPTDTMVQFDGESDMTAGMDGGDGDAAFEIGPLARSCPPAPVSIN